jgi:hypothetical protein
VQARPRRWRLLLHVGSGQTATRSNSSSSRPKLTLTSGSPLSAIFAKLQTSARHFAAAIVLSKENGGTGMASGTSSVNPTEVNVGKQVTLTIAISDFQGNSIALSADDDPGDTSGWQTVALDANNGATGPVTLTNPGSYTFTLTIDGGPADPSGNPVTTDPVVERRCAAPSSWPHCADGLCAFGSEVCPQKTRTQPFPFPNFHRPRG